MNYSPLLRMDQSYLLLHDTDFPDIQRFDGTNINITLSRKSSILYSCTLCFLIPLSNLDVFRRAFRFLHWDDSKTNVVPFPVLHLHSYILWNENPRFIFVTPSHQFPLGGTLPIQFIVHLKQILQLYYFISILPMKL